MGDTKLLPCPWCGRSARVKSNTDWHTLIVRHKNSCILRDAQTIFVPRTDEQRAVLIKDWNTRHGPALLAAAKYAEANPLGGPATMLEAAARRIRAGEDFHEVLADYGLLARQEGEDGERWRFFAAHFDKPMMREWLRRGFGLHPDAFTPSITAVVDAARSGGGGG